VLPDIQKQFQPRRGYSDGRPSLNKEKGRITAPTAYWSRIRRKEINAISVARSSLSSILIRKTISVPPGNASITPFGLWLNFEVRLNLDH
jgi:hypothetical protein